MDSIEQIAKRKADADLWWEATQMANTQTDPDKRAMQELNYALAAIERAKAQAAYDAYIAHEIARG